MPDRRMNYEYERVREGMLYYTVEEWERGWGAVEVKGSGPLCRELWRKDIRIKFQPTTQNIPGTSLSIYWDLAKTYFSGKTLFTPQMKQSIGPTYSGPRRWLMTLLVYVCSLLSFPKALWRRMNNGVCRILQNERLLCGQNDLWSKRVDSHTYTVELIKS